MSENEGVLTLWNCKYYRTGSGGEGEESKSYKVIIMFTLLQRSSSLTYRRVTCWKGSCLTQMVGQG